MVRGVPIGEALEERLVNIGLQETTHGAAIKHGKLDLFNTGEWTRCTTACLSTCCRWAAPSQVVATHGVVPSERDCGRPPRHTSGGSGRHHHRVPDCAAGALGCAACEGAALLRQPPSGCPH
jgi:hypothetical protein